MTPLSRIISAINKQLWQEGLNQEQERKIKAELTAAENDLEAFQLEVRRLSPRYASTQYPESIGAQKIQSRLLDADRALVEFMLGEKRSFVWVVSPGKLTLGVLPARTEIEALIAAYRQTLTKRASALTLKPAMAEYESQSRQLYQTLLQPVAGALASSRKLIIVPDGALAYLPFETLLAPADQSLRPSSQRGVSLLERFAITYAPSATALAAIKERPEKNDPPLKLLLAFGDTERRADFTALPYTKQEVATISALYPPNQRQVYLGREAREEAVKAEKLDAYRYLHFATHGVVNEERPARSGIVLSLSSDSTEDGLLQVGEIMRLKLKAEMVTLSACGTGLGKLLDGEGFLGLARAFFYAGARSAVVSLWNVNDAATAELMKAFYQNLQRGFEKDEAMRQAKLMLIKSQPATWRHPYFWASFVVLGERK